MTVSPIFGLSAFDRDQSGLFLQTFGDQIFDLAVLDRFYAASDLDAVVFRLRESPASPRHGREATIGSEPFTTDIFLVVEMQLRLGQRMKLVLLDRVRNGGRNYLLQHVALDLVLKSQADDIQRCIAFSKAGNVRPLGVFLADLAIGVLQRSSIDLDL